tara:strand:+ start:213 stop:398 length:186 start_codon:yes stop_codon:yes gene_type:complete
MFTLQELNEHKQVLENLMDSNCVCMNTPEARGNIVETLEVVYAMLTAVTEQLEKQSISFTS